MSPAASRMHATVRLADRIYLEDAGLIEGTVDMSLAFRATGKPTPELYEEAAAVKVSFRKGGYYFGGFVGLVAAVKLILLTIRFRRDDYTASRASCIACGRCYTYCPREHVRLGNLAAKEVGGDR